MGPIADPLSYERERATHPRVVKAAPETFKAFWPEVRTDYYFRQRRAFMDFLRDQDGKIFCLEGWDPSRSPFILVGGWRGRRDTAAIWHISAHGAEREWLVLGASRACFEEGAERMVTKLLENLEAAEFRRWGFEEACRVILLEKRLEGRERLAAPVDGLLIMRFRRKDLPHVLELDAAAFDDFWKLDARTMEAIASSCLSNLFLLARMGGEVVGYAMGGTNGRIGYLQRLGVSPRFQGRGIGKALAARMLHGLRGMGAGLAMVNTQEGNLAALTLYRSLGFRDMPDPRFILQLTRESLDGGRS